MRKPIDVDVVVEVHVSDLRGDQGARQRLPVALRQLLGSANALAVRSILRSRVTTSGPPPEPAEFNVGNLKPGPLLAATTAPKQLAHQRQINHHAGFAQAPLQVVATVGFVSNRGNPHAPCGRGWCLMEAVSPRGSASWRALTSL